MLTQLLVALITIVSSQRVRLRDSKIVDTAPHYNSEFYYDLEGLRPDYQLVITLKKLDLSEVPGTIYVAIDRSPNPNDFDWSTTADLEVITLIIPPGELTAHSSYIVALGDWRHAKWSWIAIEYSKPLELSSSTVYTNYLDFGRTAVYVINANSTQPFLALVKINIYKGKVFWHTPLSEDGPCVPFTYFGSDYYFDSSSLGSVETFQFSVTMISDVKEVTVVWCPLGTGAKQLGIGESTLGITIDYVNDYVYSIEVTRDLDLGIEFMTHGRSVHAYVKAGTVPTPNDFDLADWIAEGRIDLEKSFRQSLELVKGTYYLLVMSSQSSIFSVSVSYTNDAVPLPAGAPYHAKDVWGLKHYSIAVNNTQKYNVTARLNSISSEGYLYMKQCETHDTCLLTTDEQNNPSKYGISHARIVTGINELEHIIFPEICNASSQCELFIGLEYEEPASYALTVGSPIVLVEGTEEGPVLRHVDKGQSVHFQFTKDQETSSLVRFTLTLEKGSIALYASKDTIPTPVYYEKASLATAETCVEFVKGVDSPELKGVYTLVVYGVELSTVSLEVTTEEHSRKIQMSEGRPQIYLMREGTFKSFEFTVQDTHYYQPTIAVVQTQLMGLSQFSVSTDDKRWFVDENFFQDTRTLMIYGNDTQSSGQYSVSVRQWKPELSGFFAFSLFYKTSETIFNLTLGEPQFDEVTSGSYNYYAIELETITQSLSIVLTTESGTARLCAAFTNQYPTQDSCEKQSEDQIVVTPDDINTSCLDHKRQVPWFKCIVHVSVLGLTSSRYILQAQLSQLAPIELALNEVFSLQTSQRHNQTFSVRFEGSTPSCLTVDVTKGMLGIVGEVLQGSQSPEGIPVDPVYQQLFIQEAFTWQVPRPFPQTLFHFLVTCTMDTCEYSITPEQDEVRSLILAEPVHGTIKADHFEYFRFNCSSAERDLNFTLQSLDNVVVYIAKTWGNSEVLPSVENYDWRIKSGEFGLSQFDPALAAHSGTLEGIYILGLLSSKETEYTLAVRPVNNPVSPLHNTTEVELRAGHTQYYLHMHRDPFDLSFQWTQASGFAQVYITPLRDLSQVYSQRPNEHNYIWRMPISSETFTFVIKSTDKHACGECAYILGVVAEGTGFSATLQLQSGSFTQTLPENKEIRNQGSAAEVHYYHYTVTSGSGFEITVSSRRSSLTVEIMDSADECAPATWTKNEGVAMFKIGPSDPEFKLGTYSIRVTFNAACSYTIKGVQVHPINQLDNGVRKRVERMTGILVFESATQRDTETYCNLISSTPGFKPFVYLSYEASETNPPGPENVRISYSPADYIQNTLRFSVKVRNSFFIGVYENSTANQQFGELSIDCTIGVPTFEHELGQTHRYEMATSIDRVKLEIIAEQSGDLVVYLDGCNALYQVNISKTWDFTSTDTVNAHFTSEGSLAALYPVPSGGRYYLQATLVKALGNSQNSFSVYAALTESNQGSAFDIVPGNGGKLTLHRSNPLQIAWTDVKYANGTAIVQPVVYDVYLTASLQAFYSTPCSIEVAKNLRRITTHSKTSASLRVKQSGKYLVNVIGHTEMRSVAYVPITVTLERSAENGPWLVWLIVAVITVGLAGLVAFFTYRYRKSASRSPTIGKIELSPMARPKRFLSLDDSEF